MLSTLRACTRRGVVRLGPWADRGALLGDAPLLRAPQPRPLQSRGGRLGARFCSGDGAGKGAPGRPKEPEKGFERFYKDFPNKNGTKVEAKETEAPKETPSSQGSGNSKSSSSSGSSSSSSGGGSAGGSGKGPDKKTPQTPQQQLAANSQQLMGMAAGFALMLYLYGNREQHDEAEITIQDLLRDYLSKGSVDKIQIVNKRFCRVHLTGDSASTSNPGEHQRTLTIQLGTPEAFEAKLEQAQNEMGISPLEHVPIQHVTETDFLQELLPHLPSLLILLPLLFFARAMSGGMGGAAGPGGMGGGRNIFSIGKAFPAGQKDVKSKVMFSDVAGLEQAKKEVVEFVDFLKNPEKYQQLGARVPKGGLLVGPPGTGKTLLAKAVAGEAGCPFYSMSGSDFIEMFVGVGPSRVRDLFQQARASAPSIIFIDEIDAVGRKRSKGGFGGGGNDERENTLNQMLVEMDGFSSGTGVVVLAGTNRADILDPALTRPGRFDRQIAIDKPDLSEREAIFMVHLKPVTLAKDLPPENVAKRMSALTPGFAGSDIANVCNEAAIFAARRSAAAVEMEDFERATERILGGLPKHNSLMSPAEKRAVALHESGHAVAGWYLEHADPLLKVSIVPRSSGALGFAQYLPDEISLYSKEAILDRIAVSLGGRAAEEIFVGRISTGASDDLDKVTKMAYAMVAVYGMNPELGLLSYSQNNSSEQFYKPYSEETGQLIDREARAIIDTQYNRVKALLTEKSDIMRALADRLAEKETLVYQDLRDVLGERPFAMKEQYRKFVTAGSNPFTADVEEPAQASAEGGGAATNSEGSPSEAAVPPAAEAAKAEASRPTAG